MPSTVSLAIDAVFLLGANTEPATAYSAAIGKGLGARAAL